MALLLVRASRIVYVSTSSWKPMLQPYGLLRCPPIIWLPIPATIPRCENREALIAIRRESAKGDPDKLIVGHFGTYGDHLTPRLTSLFSSLLLKDSNLIGKFLGTGGDRFAAELLRTNPELEGRVLAPGFLSRQQLSLHLQACDLAIQPYSDGVSSRRTSVMAALINGVPTISTKGPLTEPIWVDAAVVPLIPVLDTSGLVREARELLGNKALRERLRDRELKFYEQSFSLERTIQALTLDHTQALAR